ncbi:hypothetical protein Fmac_008250 [Flemingia macrophylla]|uniref:Disease resistance protein Roq1-like winged-helix domain-containing protein n=1 Tax=Flemingia macrophylla TaxID=520843 RepID=A0ABD1MZ92_9FABA
MDMAGRRSEYSSSSLCRSTFSPPRLFRNLRGGVAEENEKPMSESELENNTPQVDVESLKCLLKDDDNDYSVAFELGRLIDKALITISEDNIVSMHDSLQEMAWEIVRQESTEDPGSRSRLWDLDDVLKALQNGKCLTTLYAGSCSSLQSLPELPKCLNVWELSSLEALPELPPSLEDLNADVMARMKVIKDLLDHKEDSVSYKERKI